MPYLFQFIVTILLCYVLGGYIPSWAVIVTAFLPALIWAKKAAPTLMIGFIAIALLYFFMVNVGSSEDHNRLVDRISDMMGQSGMMIKIITALIGGIIGGLGALLGFYLKNSLGLGNKSDI